MSVDLSPLRPWGGSGASRRGSGWTACSFAGRQITEGPMDARARQLAAAGQPGL